MEIVALVASLASIVLAVVAIYYAFKFNREGQKTLRQTQDLLAAVGRNVRYIEAVAEKILERGFKYVMDKKSFSPTKNKNLPRDNRKQ